MIALRCNPSLKPALVVLALLGGLSAAGAAETVAQTGVAGPSCAAQEKKVAEQAAEIERLHKRVEELEDELDLMDLE